MEKLILLLDSNEICRGFFLIFEKFHFKNCIV